METRNNVFDQFIQYKSLAFKFDDGFGTDMVLNDPYESKKFEDAGKIKNVCAKLPIQLVERLDTLLGTLSISKREFIQYAVIEALDRADSIMDDIDIVRFLNEEFNEGEGK